MKTLAVFGTSSNPFCHHHGRCVRWLLEEAKYDHVLVVPSAAHALKTDLPPFEHRLALAALGVASLADLAGRVEVTSIERDLAASGGPVFAYALLLAVRERWGNRFDSIHFSIGPDIPAELHRWRHVPEIEREFGFVHTPSFGAHATEVRRRLAIGDQQWRELVSTPVADYLDQHGIYRGSMPTNLISNTDG